MYLVYAGLNQDTGELLEDQNNNTPPADLAGTAGNPLSFFPYWPKKPVPDGGVVYEVGIDADGNPVSPATVTMYGMQNPASVGNLMKIGDTYYLVSIVGPNARFLYSMTLEECDQLTGSPTGGTFTLSFGGQTTSGIAYNASAATVDSALRVMSGLRPDIVRHARHLRADADRRV